MTCTACDFANPAGMKFCGQCDGALQARTACMACGLENPPGFTVLFADVDKFTGDGVTRDRLQRQALQGDDEIGAPLQAARIARELDA